MASADVAKLIAVLELKDLFSDKISRAERSLNKFESRSTKAGQQIGLGILRGAAIAAAGVTTAVAVMGKAVFAASDLNETISKTGVVFGKNAAEVLAFGKTSAAALGLSENAALSAAATYGNLFVSMGLASDKSADMSIKLVKLGGDLASFNNIDDPTEVLDKLRAGLTGESEPLKSLGININETIIKAKALELGLVKGAGSAELAKAKLLDLNAATARVKETTAKYGAGSSQALKALAAQERAQAKLKDTTAKMPGVLDPAIKAQAAYALIMEQSTTGQGDFARTSDGLAGQIKILKGNFTDMLATLGTPVLPQVAKVFKQINIAVKENQPEIAKLGEAVAAMFSDANIKNGADILKGAFETAKSTAPIIAASAKTTFGLVQAAVGLFRSLPPELQKLAVGAFAVNKLTGGLVTNIAGGIIDAVGKNVFQKGSSPANPLFVADVAGGLGGGIPGAAGKGGGILSTISKVALPVAIVSVAAEAAFAIAGIGDPNHKGTSGQIVRQNTSPEDIAKNQQAVLAALRERAAKGDTFAQKQIDAITSIKTTLTGGLSIEDRDLIRATRLTGEAAAMDARRIEAAENRTGSLVSASGKVISHTISVLGAQFGKDIRGLRAATKPVDIAKFAKAIAASVQKGSGSVAGTKGVLKDLKIKLAETHDPQLQKVLRAAIHTVEAKLPNRVWVDKELALGRKIAGSNESQTRKLADLKEIEKSLRAHGDRHAASTIRKLEQQITATKGVKTAALETRQAVKDKDLSVTIPITNIAQVTNGAITKTQTTYKHISGFIE